MPLHATSKIFDESCDFWELTYPSMTSPLANISTVIVKIDEISTTITTAVEEMSGQLSKQLSEMVSQFSVGGKSPHTKLLKPSQP